MCYFFTGRGFFFCRRQNPSSQQLGFDPRLCYGDVVLSFVYRPDKRDELPSPEFDLDVVEGLPLPRSSSPLPPPPIPALIEIARPAVDIIINDAMPMHDFVLTQFINVRLCDFCRKKVWHSLSSHFSLSSNKKFRLLTLHRFGWGKLYSVVTVNWCATRNVSNVFPTGNGAVSMISLLPVLQFRLTHPRLVVCYFVFRSS